MQRQNNRNDRDVITYKQLLNLAHQRGLRSLKTALLQIPGAENGWVAIARAEAVFVGEDGIERVYEEIGDAAPNNLSQMVANCSIRMASTRAKARALRDAVNVGAVAAEELADYEDVRVSGIGDGGSGELNGAERVYPVPETRNPIPRSKRTAEYTPDAVCTDEQRRAVLNVCNKMGLEKPENLETMTQGEAAQLLKSLQRKAA